MNLGDTHAQAVAIALQQWGVMQARGPCQTGTAAEAAPCRGVHRIWAEAAVGRHLRCAGRR